MKRGFVVLLLLVVIALQVLRNEFLRTELVAQEPKGAVETAAVSSVADVNAQTPQGRDGYVGREVCRECHVENYDLHRMHGHAHTFALASDEKVVSKFDGRVFDYGEPYGQYEYEQGEDGLSVRISGGSNDSFPLQYALGSGDHAITLLSLAKDAEKGTVAYEHRGSWFSDRDRLGRTPGQPLKLPESEWQRFGMKHVDNVMQKCIYCHTTTGTVVDQTIVDLKANVNCEKCHGPGEEHVRQARAMKEPPPFSVGSSKWDSESEIQLCGDCHRLPEAITLKELREYPDKLARFQPVGLLRSQCFIESEGALRCTTCHNPHQTISDMSETEHIANCIECHQPEESAHVSCPVSTTEGCIQCHMPKYDFESLGTGFHDHWIRVHPEG
ncbi:MAG: hypothetical protein CBD74_05205 [Saprospirales bacterium TMED214]|nr:MAG: hypothetical protein CBD74_05205 [Saprospirales bacterium TMED214]